MPVEDNIMTCLFADDTAIIAQHHNLRFLRNRIQNFLKIFEKWLMKWRISVNVNKTAALVFAKGKLSRYPSRLKLFNETIEWATQTKYLGVIIDSKLTFKPHKELINKNFNSAISILKPLIGYYSPLTLENKLLIYKQYIRPKITYACQVWGQAANCHINAIQIMQNKCLRKITKAPIFVHNYILHRDLNIPTIREFIEQLTVKLLSEMQHSDNPLIQLQTTIQSGKYRVPSSNVNLSDSCKIKKTLNLIL